MRWGSPRQWASYQIRIIAGCACAGNAGNVFPATDLKKYKPLINDPGMHHGTCVTRVALCMSGSLTSGGGENIPGIIGACATRNFTYLARGPCLRQLWQGNCAITIALLMTMVICVWLITIIDNANTIHCDIPITRYSLFSSIVRQPDQLLITWILCSCDLYFHYPDPLPCKCNFRSNRLPMGRGTG